MWQSGCSFVSQQSSLGGEMGSRMEEPSITMGGGVRRGDLNIPWLRVDYGTT